MVRTRWFVAGAAVVLAVVTSNLALASAGAAARPAGPLSSVKFTGKIACKTLTSGVAKFNPPLTSSGTAKEVATVTGTASGCSGNTTQHGLTIKNGEFKATLNFATNECTGLVSGPTGTIGVSSTWTDTKGSATAITPTKLTFSSAGVGVSSSSHAVITLPGSGGTVTGTGSFAPKGSAATGTGIGVATSDTVSQLLTACGSTGGLASAKLLASPISSICAGMAVFYCIGE